MAKRGAREGRGQRHAGKQHQAREVDPFAERDSSRPALEAVEPLYSTLGQPRPEGSYFDERAADHAVEWIERLRHFKGRWVGQRFWLLDWQRELVRTIFGWKRADGTRLYRLVYVEAPRKSGKTSLAAVIGLYLAHADGEAAPEVYFAAYAKDQAKLCYETARHIAERDPDLHANSAVYLSRSETQLRDNPGGFMRVLSRESGKLYGLNLHGLIFDELMTQKSREMWDALTTSEAAREQSLIFAISTAGWNQLSICFEQHELARQIQEGEAQDESFLGVVYGAPMDADWTDEQVWKRANPSLGETASLDYYRRKFVKAINQPTEQNAFRTLLLSQWVGQAERFLPMEAWDLCGDEPPAPSKVPGFGGLDLSATTDLTAFVVVTERDGVLDVYPRVFLPADGIEEREKRDRAPYRVWAEQGFLTLTPGRTVDYGAIRLAVLDAYERFDLKIVNYDKWNATQIVQELEDEGVNMVDIRQGFASQNTPTKELLRLVMDTELAHGGDPLLRWCASNVAAKMDPAGNVKLDKEKSAQRIDPIQALANAIDGWIRLGRDKPTSSVYEERFATA